MVGTFSAGMIEFEKSRNMGPIVAAGCKAVANFVSSKESATVRFIRTSAKLLARGADEKSGCYRSFSEFAEERGKKNTITTFKHNRFNILFHDGAAVFDLHPTIIEFLEEVHGCTNSLMTAVLNDAKETFCVAGARALGAICL